MEQATDDAATRRKAVGAVIRALRGQRTQLDLGRLLGGISQPAISAWEKGQVDLTCEQVREIEVALGVRPGTVGVAAGYVDVGLAEWASPIHDDDDEPVLSFHPWRESSELVNRLYLSTMQQALAAVEAGERLHLGVRLSNAMDPEDESLRWVVELWTEVPEMTDTGEVD